MKKAALFSLKVPAALAETGLFRIYYILLMVLPQTAVKDGVMKKIVLFLGAGASKSDGAPLQKELFTAYTESMEAPSGLMYKNDSFFEHIKEDLSEFFQRYFATDLKENREPAIFPTFEEALGILEVEGEYAGRNTVSRYKDAIVASMALAIEYQLDKKRTEENYRIIDSCHKKLVENICNNGAYAVDFLSTNYDLLIDNALLSRRCPIDYGLGHRSGTRLYKLHGSLNWLYCPQCKQIQAAGAADISVKNLLNFREHQCKICGSIKTSVIIPPTFFKNFIQYGDTIVNVWKRAYESLRAADHIIFCGYSFPHADIHIKTLLKKAEQNRVAGMPLKVSIFNGFDGKHKVEMKKEKLRYERFLKKDTIVEYRGDVAFEAFAQEPEQYL